MKKILALLLAVVCLFSVLTVGLTAAAKDDDPITGIVYEKGGVPLMYIPNSTYSFEGPAWLTVTTDKPIPADANYEFMYWLDKDGKRVDPGQSIYVTQEIVLRPYFIKTNNEDRTTSTIRSALQALVRVFERLFEFFRKLEIFNNNV